MKKIAKFSFIFLITSLTINGYLYAQSHNHNHDHHQMTEKEQQIYSGHFNDNEIMDRNLSDWAGIWQSVNGYFLDGILDPVLQAKASKPNAKTFEQYQQYYKVGYATDIDMITIEDNTMTFFTRDNYVSCEYQYAGYKVLNYQAGNRGVRYLFDCITPNSQAPKYIQFSDHSIAPVKAVHFHLYMGNESQSKLLNEMDNWPTYYPITLNKDEIVDEMLHH